MEAFIEKHLVIVTGKIDKIIGWVGTNNNNNFVSINILKFRIVVFKE